METPASLVWLVTRIKWILCSASLFLHFHYIFTLHSSARRKSGHLQDMHHLRTTLLRLRPLTAAQAAQRLSQPRLSVIKEGSRAFQPSRQSNAPGPFLNGTSSNYVEEMYVAWQENPKSVHKVQYASTLTPETQSSFRLFSSAARLWVSGSDCSTVQTASPWVMALRVFNTV